MKSTTPECPQCGNEETDRFGVIGIGRYISEVHIQWDGQYITTGFIHYTDPEPIRGRTGDVLVHCRACGHEFYTSKTRPYGEAQKEQTNDRQADQSERVEDDGVER